jgi:hypothetical protein
MGAGGTRPLPGAPGRIPMQEEKEDLTSSDEVITLFL